MKYLANRIDAETVAVDEALYVALIDCYEALKVHKPHDYALLPMPAPISGDRCSGPYHHHMEAYSKQQQTLGALAEMERLISKNGVRDES